MSQNRTTEVVHFIGQAVKRVNLTFNAAQRAAVELFQLLNIRLL